MKKTKTFSGVESFEFGDGNKLRVFPPNTYKFKPKDHIMLDEVQECILDNFWFWYNNKRDEKGYLLSILNSLAEYFNTTNELNSPEKIQVPQEKPIYVTYDGKSPGVYVTYEQIAMQKIEARFTGGLIWKKYLSIDEALAQARKILGPNYYIEPAAKQYISLHKKATKSPIIPPEIPVKGEGSASQKPTYKESLIKGLQPSEIEYIDLKINEKYDNISPQWKNEIKNEVLAEIRKEMQNEFANIKKEYADHAINEFLNNEVKDDDMEISLDNESVDLRGHGQPAE